MKTPITYYGGKQLLASKVIELIPEHKLYCEPFIGGGAVFFQKEPSPVEVINDTNHELINFYEVCKRDFTTLEKEVSISLHSRDLHRKARVIHENPDMFDSIKRAWAVWVLANQSYGAMLDGSFGYDRSGTTTKKITNKREAFNIDYAIRLQNCQIECTDALKIIKSRDTKESFFYCDPPYIGTDMAHFDGYLDDDFMDLINILENIEGKFLLSSFRHKALSEAIEKNQWYSFEIKMCKSMSRNAENKHGTKIEVLTANYPIF